MEWTFIFAIWQEKNVSLIPANTPIKFLPEETKVLCSLIALSIKEGDFSDACKFVSCHFTNGSSRIKSINIYQSYSPVAYAESFRINIAITDIHRLATRILGVSNAFHNTNVPIHERVCVSPPTYYLDWFEIFYHNVPINLDDGPFFLQCMNGVQGTKPSGQQWNRPLDSVFAILNIRRAQLIMIYTSKSSLIEQLHILHFPLMMLSTLLIRLVPSQDVPYALILWYVSKIIYLS